MGHLHRFYIDPSTPTGAHMRLQDAEAHHAIHVVRVQLGDEVLLFDGAGRAVRATVRLVTRHEVEVAVAGESIEPPESPRILVCVGWPKRAKAAEFITAHGTEVGVQHFTFFRAERSEKQPELDPKWTRTAIEACKQCGRLWLPTFSAAAGLEEALETAEGRLYLCTQHRPAVPLKSTADGAATILVGPEGDFTESELELAGRLGAKPISLGRHTLRTEMAVLVAAVLVRAALGSDCAG